MNPQIEQQTGSPKDTALLLLAVALVAGGMVAFYMLADGLNALVRTLILLAAIGAGVAAAYRTQQGKTLWSYVQGARIELRKTTWPTRQESVQTTLMIAVVVLVASLILWGLDSLLLWGVKSLTGRG
ncbi:MAG: preprotein translocase subunit SecE [Gammaproteobacteria bacterium]|nr:preprotein translocase subunit SecE [Gammaproteobacteria bacterium]